MADLSKKLSTYVGSGPKIKYKDMGDDFFAEVVAVEGLEIGDIALDTTALEEDVQHVGTRSYVWGSMINVAVGSASVQSAAVGTAKEYEINSDADCYILIGTSPTATINSRYLPAGAAFTVRLAATDRVAFIRKSVDGRATILPVA